MKGHSDTDIPISLLVVDPSVNDAEDYINTLRNAGLVIHPQVVTDPESLLDSEESERPDLILLSIPETEEKIAESTRLCRGVYPDTACVMLYKNPQTSPALLLQAMRDGARDVVSVEDPERLQLVIRREAVDLHTRKTLHETLQKLKEAESRCNTLIVSSQDAIAYIHEGMHMQANPAYLEMFGYVSMDELEGLPILDMVAADDHKQVKTFLKNLGDGDGELQVTCQNSAGETFRATLIFSAATYDGEPCTQIVIRNDAQSRELEHTIEMLSSQDAQTGLANRQYFMNRMEQKLEQLKPAQGSCSLFYIVLDEFADIRARLGILESDNMLKEVAGILTPLVGENELLARFGDHSFTLLSDTLGQEAEQKAEQLLQRVDDFIYKEINITCSIGVALLDQQSNGGQDFINSAYNAYEAARNEGGNRVSLYDPSEMQPSFGESNTGDEARINELIAHALDNDRFRLVFQPIVSLQGDSREHYAVLTRLLDKNNEEILPDFFIKPAIEGEQMARVDRWVIEHAIQEIAGQRNEGRKVNFFINLSSTSLQDEGILLWICDCLRKHKAKGAWLTFQVRDKDLRNHIQAARKLIDGLKKIKCQLAIDQFGSNPKAETLLKHLPVDFVKFDFDLLEDLATNQKKQDQLNELNKLAMLHKVKTIAMGVEDANSLAVLWTVGVNYIQGYFLQEPSENISYEFGNA
ncbi:MAG: EAL domain-containing protein [Sedimenticola sp.]|nr:EAL domain-containing protein [Sedimenticola sp.]